jgi:hypothetical protein
MKNTVDNPQRRRILVATTTALAAAPFLRLSVSDAVADADLPHLSEDDPTAKALKYKHDAAEATRADKGGVAAAEQFCHNCKFIQSDSGQWRPCQLFPQKAVNADGWCASWIAK